MRVPIARRFLDRLRLLWLDKTIRYAAIEISGETRRVSRTTMADVAAIASSSPLPIIIKMVYFWSICCGIFSIFSWKRKFFLSKEQVFWMTSIKILRVLDVLLFFFFVTIYGTLAGTLLGQFCEIVNASIVELPTLDRTFSSRKSRYFIWCEASNCKISVY